MAKLYNLAGMSTATTGTGTITLGSAMYGHLTFANAGVTDGDLITYAIKDGAASEIGRGTYTASGTTLTRTVLKSTNSNAAISLSGSAEVYIMPAAEDIIEPPTASVDSEIVLYSGTTGDIIKRATTTGIIKATSGVIAAATAGTDYVAPTAVPGANLLINGDFQINQRVFAGGSLDAAVYGFDRWKAGTGGCSISISSYVVTLASGPIAQVIEPAVFGYSSLASMTFTVSIDTPSVGMTVAFGSDSDTITAGSGRRSVTLTTTGGDTGNLTLTLSAGSSVTFRRVKLEVGSTATDWQARPTVEEVALCMRYYQNGFPNGVAPVEGYTFTQSYYASGISDTGNRLYAVPVTFQVPMRTTPTVFVFRSNVAATTNGRWQYFNGSAWVAGSSTFPGTINEKGFRMTVDGTGLTAGSSYLLIGGWAASSEL